MTPETLQLIEKAIVPMHGWCTIEKASRMYDLILEQKPEVVVEIGVFGGRSLVPQAMALREVGAGTIYGIDPWLKEAALEGENGQPNDEWWNSLDLNAIFIDCVAQIAANGLNEWSVLLRSKSMCAAKMFGLKIDILHIDGNHSEQTSVADVQAWLPKVRKGGHIWFDDIDWPSTEKARALMLDKCEAVGDFGNCRLYRKLT